MTDIPRKEFIHETDRTAAERVEGFIVRLRHGAGTWPDGADFPIDNIVAGGRMRIVDKIETNEHGPERHVELYRGRRLIVTLVYDHSTHRLVRTF